MKIYWAFLIISIILMLLYNKNYQTVYLNGQDEKRALKGQGMLFFAILCFFCGLRSGIADTGTYIWMFQGYPSNISDALHGLRNNKDYGFMLLSVFMKQFISEDFHVWLFVIAFVSCTATYLAFRKYAPEFGMTCFLFIATTWFTYLVNGMRQYICISIIIACSGWIIDRKYVRFIILILLLSTIHASALIFLPLLLIVNAKPWSWRMLVALAVAVVFGYRIDLFMGVLGNVLEETQYEGYISYIENQGAGSNIIRLVLAALPPVLAFIGRKVIEKKNNRFMNFAINMSLLNLCVYIVATFTSGMALGRIAAYFDIYNLFLLPWLLDVLFEGASKTFMRITCVGCYIVYFWYQMTVAWSIGYESDILHLFI